MPKRTTSSLDPAGLARRELTVVHPRVYIDHTGRLSLRQRQWAAVLACAPAALHRESALDAHGMTKDRTSRDAVTPIRLLVGRHRRITAPDGVVVERVADHESWVQGHRRPPRAELDFALLKAAPTATALTRSPWFPTLSTRA